MQSQASRDNRTYNAIIAAYKAMHRRMNEMLAEEGLTQPQFQALRIVSRKKAVCMREISDEMLVTPANVTGIIDRLESKGLLRRTGKARDRRATQVELTRDGTALQARVATKYNDFVKSALEVFTGEEEGILGELLVKLQEGMSRPWLPRAKAMKAGTRP